MQDPSTPVSPRKGIIRLAPLDTSSHVGPTAAGSTAHAGPSRDAGISVNPASLSQRDARPHAQGDDRRARHAAHRHQAHETGGRDRERGVDRTEKMKREQSASHVSREGRTSSMFVRSTESSETDKSVRPHEDNQSELSEGRASTRRQRQGEEGKRHAHSSHPIAFHAAHNRDNDGGRGVGRSEGGGSNGGKLFDPRKDDPVRFTALRKGIAFTHSSDAHTASMTSQSADARSMASSATPSVTTMSTASSEGRERRRRRGPGSRTTIDSGETGSGKRKGQHSGAGDTSASDNNSYVVELKRRYRDVVELERKLQAEHKTATEQQRKYQAEHDAKLTSATTSQRTFSVRQAIGEGHGAKSDGSLDFQYWLNLIKQHRTLAEFHVAFMEAALLPGLPASLHSLPQTYKIPVRLWHTGFHSLLERFRSALPDWQTVLSMHENGVAPVVRRQIGEVVDLMTEFIYFAYSYYSNILESELFKVFRSFWIENLGDLARYRMMIAKMTFYIGLHDGVRHEAQRRDSFSSKSHAPISKPSEQHSPEERPFSSDEQDPDAALAATTDDEEVEKVSAQMGNDQASIGAAAAQTWDLEEKEVWRSTARGWYAKGLAEVPGTGRLHHHLGILSRDDDLRSLYHLSKSLTTSHPFPSTRESILPLFERAAQARRVSDTASLPELFVHLHGILFTRIQLDDFDDVLQRFNAKLQEVLTVGALDSTSDALSPSTWMMMATINIAAVLNYGADDVEAGQSDGKEKGVAQSTERSRAGEHSVLKDNSGPTNHAVDARHDGDEMDGVEDEEEDEDEDEVGHGQKASTAPPVHDGARPEDENELPVHVHKALTFAFDMLGSLIALFFDDVKRTMANPYVTILLTFFSQECKQQGALRKMEKYIPWERLVALGNAIPANVEPIDPRNETSLRIRGDAVPLPEDWCLRGMAWVGRRVYERGFWKPHKLERLGLRTSLQLFESEMDMIERCTRHCDNDAVHEEHVDGDGQNNNDVDDDDDDDDEEEDRDEIALHGQTLQPKLTLSLLRWKRIVHALTILIKLVPGLDFDIDGGQVHARHGKLVVAPPLKQKLVDWQAEATRLEVERAIGHVKLAALEGRTSPKAKEYEHASEQEWEGEDEDDEGVAVDFDRAATPQDEVQELVKKRNELKSQLEEARNAIQLRSAVTAVGTSKGALHPRKAVKGVRDNEQRPSIRMVPGYTTLVLDTNVMLAPTDILNQLAESGRWLIVLPLPVVTELDGLKRRSDDVGERAQKALANLEERIKTKHVRVQTSRGNYLSDLRFRSEDIQFSAIGSGSFWPATYGRDGETTSKAGVGDGSGGAGKKDSTSEVARSVDDVILRCLTWQAGSHWRNRLILFSTDDAELARREAQVANKEGMPPVARAVLITLDRNLRVKTRFRQLYAIGPDDLINLILESTGTL